MTLSLLWLLLSASPAPASAPDAALPGFGGALRWGMTPAQVRRVVREFEIEQVDGTHEMGMGRGHSVGEDVNFVFSFVQGRLAAVNLTFIAPDDDSKSAEAQFDEVSRRLRARLGPPAPGKPLPAELRLESWKVKGSFVVHSLRVGSDGGHQLATHDPRYPDLASPLLKSNPG